MNVLRRMVTGILMAAVVVAIVLWQSSTERGTLLTGAEVGRQLYQIDKYLQVGSDLYLVDFVKVPEVSAWSFDDLVEQMYQTAGDCKFVTSCVVKWAQTRGIPYVVCAQSEHVVPLVEVEGDWFVFNRGIDTTVAQIRKPTDFSDPKQVLPDRGNTVSVYKHGKWEVTK